MIDQVLADEQFNMANQTIETLWLLGDHQGSIRDIAKDNSSANTTTIQSHRVYDAFGNLISQTNPAVDTVFGFVGRQWDEQADLYFNRARYVSVRRD
jgi:YD repeat-containing protein